MAPVVVWPLHLSAEPDRSQNRTSSVRRPAAAAPRSPRTRRSRLSSRSKSASSACRNVTERSSSSLMKVSTTTASSCASGDAAQLLDRLARGHRFAVGVARRHHVVGVRDRDDPCGERDLVADEPVRIAAAVDPLVMSEDDLGDRAVALDAGDEPGALLGVHADDVELLLRELGVGEQDRVGEDELADVVQQRGRVDHVLLAVARAPARWRSRASSARRRPSDARSSCRAATASAARCRADRPGATPARGCGPRAAPCG